jgi:exonuclease SbcC
VRPLRLDLTGFTAFRDPASVDFAELDVFAIAGPTGSGKSSLLDAMTYALFGRVERVGDRVSLLISQGQPRMAVTFEFEVGRDRYRVTRTTPARGATRIQLERQVGGGWQQAGEGSDRVRGADALIAGALGLSYDAFTRSVLLPQGKFAELLVGDARTRRDILTELLGLALFRRMAERAGAIARESGVRCQERAAMVEREYADATPEALRRARAAAKQAAAREQRLVRAAERVMEILERWEAAERSGAELRACADLAARAAESTAAAGEELAGLAKRVAEARSVGDRAAADAEAAAVAFEAAAEARRQAVADAGEPAVLMAAQVHAQAMRDVARRRDQTAARRATAEAGLAALTAADEAAGEAVAARRSAVGEAEAAAAEAAAALEDATHADLVAAVSTGLQAGDPCPVCGAPLTRAPARGGRQRLERARRSDRAARRAVEAARGELTRAEAAADAVRRDIAANATERARLDEEAGTLDAQAAEHRRALVAVLGDPLPPEPEEALEQRVSGLQALERAERDTAVASAEGARAQTRADQDLQRLLGQAARLGERVRADHGPLAARAAAALGTDAPPLPVPPDDAEPEELAGFARELGPALAALEARLATAARDAASAEGRLLEEARTASGDLVEPTDRLEDLARLVADACRAATADVATSDQRAEDLERRLERRAQLEAEVRALTERERRFRALAQELRADRLIAFLQSEALQLLAAAGSERLGQLSDGRYRITCRDDEFLVVDAWNGEEERSVRTLSGGETFLASLALALALADQVRSLSVTDRARLDSLFLDEGFGTLDPESLRTVTDAIEQLGGDGRLVGIITHVRELAEQFPRIEVTKSPRGSRLELVT